jgi:uncharacterized protein (UPF0303 family)
MSEATTDPELDVRIATITEQQATLQLPSFDSGDVWRLGGLLVEYARDRGLGIAVRISRGDQVAFHWASDAASLDNDGWLERKTRTVTRYGDSSLLVGLNAKKSGTRASDRPWIDPALYSFHGGAVPVAVRGVGLVAVAAVSGLDEVADHDLVVEAIEMFLASV